MLWLLQITIMNQKDKNPFFAFSDLGMYVMRMKALGSLIFSLNPEFFVFPEQCVRRSKYKETGTYG